MPDTSQLSQYLKIENVRDGDVIEIMDAGKIVTKTFGNDKNAEPKQVLEITVRFRGEPKTYTPNGTTLKLLNKEWGTITEKWIGKKAKITIIPSNNGKEMIVSKPVNGNQDKSEEEVPF